MNSKPFSFPQDVKQAIESPREVVLGWFQQHPGVAIEKQELARELSGPPATFQSRVRSMICVNESTVHTT